MIQQIPALRCELDIVLHKKGIFMSRTDDLVGGNMATYERQWQVNSPDWVKKPSGSPDEKVAGGQFFSEILR